MPREAALTAKLGLDDTDLQRKIRAQSTNYQSLLRENKRYRDQLLSQNNQSRSKELAAEKAHNAALVRENRRIAAENLAGSGPAAPRLPAITRTRSQSIRSGSGTRPGQKGSSDAATNSGMGLLMLSQGIDDVQYGFKGIVNNIAPLVMALGGGSGLAGAMTILAIGINQAASAWDKWFGSTDLAKANAKSLAEYHERIAKAVKESGAAGAASGDWNSRQVEQRQAGGENMQRVLDREQRLLDLQTQLKLVQAERLDGVQRLQKEWEINSAAEREKLQADLRTAQRNLEYDTAKTADLDAQIKASESELAAIAAREKRLLEQYERDKINGKGGPEAPQLSGRDQERRAFLQNQLGGLKSAAAGFDQMRSQGANRVLDLQQQLNEEAAAKEKIHQEQIRQAREKAQQDFLEGLREFGIKAGRAFMEKLGDEMEKGRKLLAQKATRDQITGNLQIAELRMQGKNKQADALEKNNFLQNRTAALKAEGFSDKEAADIAGREFNVAHPPTGRRRIKGAVSKNRRSGIDGEFLTPSTDFDAFQDQSKDVFGLKEATTQKRTQQNLKLQKVNENLSKATATGDTATVQELRELKRAIVEKLDQLNNTTKGPAADQLKPARVVGG